VTDIERQAPMHRDAIFGVASMSKPVTAAAALRLVEQGVIALEDPITRWAPEFARMRVLRRPDGPLDETDPAPRQITVEDLMTHRSGLGYGFTEKGPLAAALMKTAGFGIDSAKTPDEWMAALAALPLACAPGERFNYGHSTDVLGFVIARAAGLPLRELMRREIFEPLGMADTDFWIPPHKRERAVAPYSSPAPGQFERMRMEGFNAAGPPAFTSGGQGLVTTADDYLAFARMLMGGGEADGVRLLKPETVRLMTTNRLSPAQRQGTLMGMPIFATSGMGLGVSVIMDEAGHAARGAGRAGAFTWPGAFGGWWQADPAADMILIWLQMVLPAQPAAGVMPRLPGMQGTLAFQKAAYAAFAG
jgi:CubicO group peptidase (beta-lactamase class C family)